MSVARARAAAMAAGLAAFMAAYSGMVSTARAATKVPGYSLANVGAFGGEPTPPGMPSGLLVNKNS